jgi:hypothetical protein
MYACQVDPSIRIVLRMLNGYIACVLLNQIVTTAYFICSACSSAPCAGGVGSQRKRRAGVPHVGPTSMNSPSYLPTAANSRVGRRGMAIGSVYLGSAD